MSQAAHAPELPYCRNCHFTLATPRPVYCGHCGQETDLHPPSVREMFTEYLGHYVAFDGPLWRTLWALVCLPGHLTNAYFHGQRRRYVLPLRVYLSMSFVFFVGLHLLAHDDADAVKPVISDPHQAVTLRVEPGKTPAQTAAEAAAIAASAAGHSTSSALDKVAVRCGEQGSPGCTGSARWVSQFVKKWEHMTREQWTSRAWALAPYAMLAMQPVFAALLLAMFAGSGRRYAEHFVFSLHSHSLWFLAWLLASLTSLEGTLSLAVFGHGLLALSRVYGLSWWGAGWRGVALSIGYFALLIIGLMVALALIVTTA